MNPGPRCPDCSAPADPQTRRAEDHATWCAVADAEITRLQAEIDTAIADTEADQGEEIVEAGGWADITRAVVQISGASRTACREVLRMAGLDPDPAYARR